MKPTFLQKIAERFRPGPRTIAMAHRLSIQAHRDWVVVFFFLLFFSDCILLFLPSDSLLAVTLLFAPDRQRPWVLAAIAGTLLSLAIFYFASLSPLKPQIIELIKQSDLSNTFDTLTAAASKSGYWQLVAGVLTFVPAIVCLVGGIFVGLNPFAVFIIAAGGRIVRLFIMIAVTRTLKISAVGIKNYIVHHRHEHHEHEDRDDKILGKKEDG